jgi:tRNA modification GTPase
MIMRAPPTRPEAQPPGFQAVLTPPGRGGIAVIRCIGPRAEAAIAACFRPAQGAVPFSGCSEKGTAPLANVKGAAPNLPLQGRIAYGHITDDDDRPVDEVIVYRATAEAFEVNCHGGPAAVQAVGRRLAALGLEPVDPDRLMELEGLPRLERDARRALRRASTSEAARILLDQLSGALAVFFGRAVTHLRAGRAADAQAVLDELARRWFSCGRYLDQPPRIAIAGRPNAGKSTLLNRLAGADRAITSPVPGTTRDTVETEAALDGVPAVLVDTAGLRDAPGTIEREGVERARRELAAAAVVVYLVDATQGATDEDQAEIAAAGPRVIIAWSKIDAAGVGPASASSPAQVGLGVSALTGAGMSVLVGEILRRLGWRPPPPGGAVPFTMDQVRAVGAAREATLAGDLARAEAILSDLLA